jgi:hypothetical protein
MDSFDDRQLSEMLEEWKAPDAPPTLRNRVLPRQPAPAGPARPAAWRWLLTGSIRIPVPVGVAALIVLALWLYSQRPSPPVPVPPGPPVTLADFQPVVRLEPKIVGEP